MPISLRENMLKVLRCEEPDYLPLRSDFAVGISSGCNQASVATAANPVAYDWFGRKWIYEPKIGASNPDVNNPIMTDITEWKEKFIFPDLSKIDWEAFAAKDTAHWNRDEKVIRFISNDGLWETLFNSMNFVDALCALEEESEACFDFFSAVADFKVEYHNYIAKYYKPDIITMHDDYGSGQGLFMSPATWRKLIKPNLKKVVDNCHENEIIYQHHCCGYMEPLLDDMINDLSIKSWQLIHVVNKPVELYQKYGKKIALIDGLLDAQVIDNDKTTEEEIRQMVRDLADAICPGGAPVVISASTVINHPERQAIVNDEIVKYAQQYYKEKRPE